jgi:tetratricopeptide (TPR) repeat protein
VSIEGFLARRSGETAKVIEHPDTAASLISFAALLNEQDDSARAQQLIERALVICEKSFGTEHPETAHGLQRLARVLLVQGDDAGAQSLYQRAIAIIEKTLGPENPVLARSLGSLGGLLMAQGDLTGARPLVERALAIREMPGLLAQLLLQEGDLTGARLSFARALASDEKTYGPENPFTAISIYKLAEMLEDEGDLGRRVFCMNARWRSTRRAMALGIFVA